MGYITDKKLNARFKEFEALELKYDKTAEKFAQRYKQGPPLDPDELRKLRIQEASDSEYFKGDWIVQLFLGAMQVKPFTRWDKGRRLGISNKLLDKVLRNHITKSQTPKAFCAENPLSLYTYRSIINLTVNNEADHTRITARHEAIVAKLISFHETQT
ncbi:MAG: hypothetical protein LBM98_08640 [Oscillospiraceae bacterium]|jgi:hypothetical protein|nr:hypothetical protein [Oscillospiraceae bacterium]